MTNPFQQPEQPDPLTRFAPQAALPPVPPAPTEPESPAGDWYSAPAPQHAPTDPVPRHYLEPPVFAADPQGAAPANPFLAPDYRAHTSPYPRVAKTRRGLGFGAVTGITLLALVAGAGGGVLAMKYLPQAATGPQTVITQSSTPGSTPDLSRAPGSVADTAAKVLPSVVSLHVASGGGASTGSGFVLAADGYIVTNDHVIDAAKDGATITVTFSDGQKSKAALVGSTVEYDLAVIKVDRSDLVPLQLADSDALVVGDQVIAIGAPLGLEGTVTSGIISALNRPVTAGDYSSTSYINAIQTDAAINPGNSGGPLVNVYGEVVGVNSAIAQTSTQVSGTTGSIGLGFAIGSNQVGRTAAQIIEKGYATFPVIGVLLNPAYQGEGVQIVTGGASGQDAITPGGPADKAGLKPGEIILAINGRPVTQSDELIVAIRAKAPGDEVELTVRSGSQERQVTMVLGETKSE